MTSRRDEHWITEHAGYQPVRPRLRVRLKQRSQGAVMVLPRVPDRSIGFQQQVEFLQGGSHLACLLVSMCLELRAWFRNNVVHSLIHRVLRGLAGARSSSARAPARHQLCTVFDGSEAATLSKVLYITKQ
jgi:hypothetical protein